LDGKSLVPQIESLINAFDAMHLAGQALGICITQDGTKDLPFLLPTYEGPDAQAREAAWLSLTRLWFPAAGETPLSAGLLCASEETLDSARQYNDTKTAFFESVKALRELDQSSSAPKLEQLLNKVLKKEGMREGKLELAIQRLGLSLLDLNHCYAKIRILPANLESISWTWATRNSRIEQITYKNAESMADALTNEKSQSYARDQLGRLKPGEPLARKRMQPPQLRANLVFYKDGKRTRQLVPLSGIALSRDLTLPNSVWRDASSQERLSRNDAGIEQEAHIESLMLYRYLPGFPKKLKKNENGK